MPGPPPKPTAALRLAGSWRAATRKREPAIPLAEPTQPEWLTEQAREAWQEAIDLIRPMRVLTASDSLALAQLAEYLARWKAATAALARIGDVVPVRSDAGTVVGLRRSPYVTMQIEYGLMVRRYLQEFGLSPSARGRLASSNEQAEVGTIFSRSRAVS